MDSKKYVLGHIPIHLVAIVHNDQRWHVYASLKSHIEKSVPCPTWDLFQSILKERNPI